MLDGECLPVHCTAHIINFIVHFGLKEIQHSIRGIHNIVRYVRSSLSRLLKFQNCVGNEKIEYKDNVVLDVPTRWNSIYLMLNSTLTFEKTFEKMENEGQYYLQYFLR